MVKCRLKENIRKCYLLQFESIAVFLSWEISHIDRQGDKLNYSSILRKWFKVFPSLKYLSDPFVKSFVQNLI